MSIARLTSGCLALLLLAGGAQAKAPRLIKPSAVDAVIRTFDDPNVVIAASSPGLPLAIFMPGTGGKPDNVVPLLQVVAAQGYAVIGLEYPDDPAVVQDCVHNADPACSADFRQMRLHGTGPFKLESNTVAESIIGRLTALLVRLDKDYPAEGWGHYLKDGAPDWSVITVSGQSQGAGMAAYLAKETPVMRVVLFSSPWDFQSTDKGPVLAPWLAEPGATPPERWFGVYNAREKTAGLLADAYATLKIPADHIHVLSLDLPAGMDGSKSNSPYHGMGIHDPRYADEWRFLYGHGAP